MCTFSSHFFLFNWQHPSSTDPDWKSGSQTVPLHIWLLTDSPLLFLPCSLSTRWDFIRWPLILLYWFICSINKYFVVVQSNSMTPWTVAHQAPLSTTVSWNLVKFISIESVMLSNHLILCPPLLLLPSIFLSIRIFSNKLAFPIRWPKYCSFSFSISPSNEFSGLIPFGLTGLISLQPKGLSRVFYSTPIWKHQFFVFQPSLWSISHICT